MTLIKLIKMDSDEILELLKSEYWKSFAHYENPKKAEKIYVEYASEKIIPMKFLRNTKKNSKTTKQLDAKLRNLSLKWGLNQIYIEDLNRNHTMIGKTKSAHLSPGEGEWDIDSNGYYSNARMAYEESSRNSTNNFIK